MNVDYCSGHGAQALYRHLVLKTPCKLIGSLSPASQYEQNPVRVYRLQLLTQGTQQLDVVFWVWDICLDGSRPRFGV